jgi:hypothetical protein
MKTLSNQLVRLIAFYIFILLLLNSCFEAPEKLEYLYIRRQLTPDRKHYIYDYSREGAFVTSSEVSGRRLIEINEPFTEKAGLDVSGVIDHWADDTLVIHVYHANYEQPKDTLPIKTEYESYDGIVIKKIYEQPLNSGGLEGKFDFDSIKTDQNKLILYGVHRQYGNAKYLNTQMSFPLGPIVVSCHKDSITKIEIEKQYKSMDFTLIDKSGKSLHNQPEIGIGTYKFTPREKINPNSLREIGVFLDVKLMPKS